jgi:membrane protease subunit (stomatin/prohibitin family)
MALIDVIKHEIFNDGLFLYKYPDVELVWGAQLVVREGQQAIFVKGGKVCDTFYPGTHTLTTGNIPILEKLINLPFGGDSPFVAEVWYVNTTVKRDLKWGTAAPIQLFDQQIGFPVTARSFGKWGVRINDPLIFLKQIVGTQSIGNAEKINDYFMGHLLQSLVEQIATDISSGIVSILSISSALGSLSTRTFEKLKNELAKYGVELINFDIESITISDDEMLKIQEVFAQTFEARELSKVNTGGAYAQIKSFDVLQSAAENPSESSVGAMLGAGIGLGAGFPIGGQMAQQMNIHHPSSSNEENVREKLKSLKSMFEDGLITEEQFKEKQQELLEKI